MAVSMLRYLSRLKRTISDCQGNFCVVEGVISIDLETGDDACGDTVHIALRIEDIHRQRFSG